MHTILNCKFHTAEQTWLRPGNEASMEWVSDPPTSISFFSCSRVLNLFWTSLIRLNTCTSPDPAPVPCFEPARKELWKKQRRREYRSGRVQSAKSKVHLKCYTYTSFTNVASGFGKTTPSTRPMELERERDMIFESDYVTQTTERGDFS